MSAAPEPERLVVEDLSDAERRGLRGGLDGRDVAAVERLAGAISSLDADAWRAAETPPLRFVPDGAGRSKPLLHRVCVRGDAGEHQIGALGVAVLASLVLLVGGVVGFALRGAGDDSSAPVVEARLESAPAVSLVRTGAAPVDASGVARMVVAGRDGRMTLRAHGLPQTGPGRWYQVWMLRDAREMVSVGTFRVRPDGTVAARFRVAGVDPSRYPTMDVSLQTQADGDAHSGRSVLRSRPAA